MSKLLAFSITMQLLKTVARWNPEIVKATGSVKDDQLPFSRQKDAVEPEG